MKKSDWFVDGYLLGSNPSKKGGGFTIFEGDRLHTTQEILCPFRHLQVLTNNDTELLALCFAIDIVPPGSTIYSDSQIALGWLRKGKAKTRKDLNGFIETFTPLIYEKKLTLEWSPREENAAGHYNDDVIHGKPTK